MTFVKRLIANFFEWDDDFGEFAGGGTVVLCTIFLVDLWALLVRYGIG